MLELRRHLHAHPELSGEEHQTAALVAGELRQQGWQVREAVGRTGVVADRALREALVFGWTWMPCRWRSTPICLRLPSSGVMHACGHDLHLHRSRSGRIPAASACRDPLQRGVRLLFQPAEELATGARWMRDDGALDGLSALYGVHVFPSLAVGTVWSAQRRSHGCGGRVVD